MTYGFGYTWLTRTTGFISRTILHFRRTELDYMIEFIKKQGKITILDYGCNTGYFLKMIKKTAPNNECFGADINPHALDSARIKNPDIKFYDLNNETIDNQFDIIILSHVLEHVDSPEILLKKLVSYLKKDGYLLVAVPQERIRGDATVFQILYNLLRLRFTNPHILKINYDNLNKYCQNIGLKIIDKVYTNYLFPFKSPTKRLDAWSLVVVAKNELSY